MKPEPEDSFVLLERARDGDRDAVDELCARYMPRLRRWATGRLPGYARGLMETDDLIQETVLGAVRHLESFEHRREGALLAYLRQAVRNRIRNEVTRVLRKPPGATLDPEGPSPDASPLEEAIGSEALDRYEQALAALKVEDREAIVARVEMGGSYADVARALGKSSPDAARMAVSRALVRLAKQMGQDAGS